MNITLLILPFLISASSICLPDIPATCGRRHWNKERGYAPFRYSTPDGIKINNTTSSPVTDGFLFDRPLSSFSISFKAANLSSNPSKRFTFHDSSGKKRHRRNPEWSFYLVTPDADTISFTIKAIEIPDPISSHPAMSVEASASSGPLHSAVIRDGVDCMSGPNIWNLSADDSGINVSCGNHGLSSILRIESSMKVFNGFGFKVSPAGRLSVTDMTFSDNTPPNRISPGSWRDPVKLKQKLENSDDQLEGYWTIFDRTLDESLLQMGGDYRLAIVNDNGRYLIIYLSGARTHSSSWNPGDIKGILTPDPFPGTYSVVWYDAEGNPLSKDIKAQIEEDDILLIQFPYHSSVMRLRRLGIIPDQNTMPHKGNHSAK